MAVIGEYTIYGLWHPGRRIYSGYGLSLYPDRHDVLVGLLMVDRPQPVDQIWLGLISVMYGHPSWLRRLNMI